MSKKVELNYNVRKDKKYTLQKQVGFLLKMVIKGEKMNQYISCCFLILISASFTSFAESNDNYWECSSHDAENANWTSRSIYQKIALNFSFAECKKNSKVPASCEISNDNCAKFTQGVNVIPTWQCTSFDKKALAWKGHRYENREDAALAAQARCKQRSSVPSTCFINLVACLNKNER